MRALALFVLVWATPALAQMVFVMSRSGYVRDERNSSSPDCYHAQAGESLVIRDEDQTNGYYHVLAENGCDGYVYKGLGRRRPDTEMPTWAGGTDNDNEPGPTVQPGVPRTLRACSFNMCFPGQGPSKQYQAMVNMLEDYDMVVVQELVAPPEPMTFSGITIPSTVGSVELFNLMSLKGFAYALSHGKTGPTVNNTKTNSCEYYLVFYKPQVLDYVEDRSRFIHDPLAANPVFKRVPWEFHFRTDDGTLDFSVINVHFPPDLADKPERRDELAFAAQYAVADPERDQFIVGDMNFHSCTEMQEALPAGFAALNHECHATNMSVNGKPYDHVMYRPQYSANDIVDGSFAVLDLQVLMAATWNEDDGEFPELPPSTPQKFGSYFSDHKPIEWRMRYGIRDDD